MSIRFKNTALKVIMKEITHVERRFNRALEFAERVSRIAPHFPDELIPGSLRLDTWILSKISIYLPYDLRWYTSFKKKMEEKGWTEIENYETEFYVKNKDQTSRLHIFQIEIDDHTEKIYIYLEAEDDNAKCKLVKLGEEEKTEMVPIYEIICAEGEEF